MSTTRAPQYVRQDLEAELARIEKARPASPHFEALRVARIEAIKTELATLPAAPLAEVVATDKDANAEWQRYVKAQRAHVNAERRLEYSCRSR